MEDNNLTTFLEKLGIEVQELTIPEISDLQKRSKIQEVDFQMDEIINQWKLEVKKPINIYTRTKWNNPQKVIGEFETTNFYGYTLKGMKKLTGEEQPPQPLIFVRDDGFTFFNPLIKGLEYSNNGTSN